MKKINKEHQTLSFQFFINRSSILMFFVCFFMWFARFQILICVNRTAFCKSFLHWVTWNSSTQVNNRLRHSNSHKNWGRVSARKLHRKSCFLAHLFRMLSYLFRRFVRKRKEKEMTEDLKIWRGQATESITQTRAIVDPTNFIKNLGLLCSQSKKGFFL